MRIFLAGFMHETSSFSAIPTSRRSFEEGQFYRPERGRETPDPAADDLIGYGIHLRKARERGYQAFPSLYTFAEPGAPCRSEDYESLRDEILADLRAAMPIDMVLLFLHGAHMAQGYDDCDGDLIARVREIVGPGAFIGVELDLHGNISRRMLDESNAVLACRYYPHTDFDERADQLFDIGERAVRGEIRTANHFHRVPMLGMFYTTLPEVKAVNDEAEALEQEAGIHAVSLMHGFPWADQPDTGAGIVIVADPGRRDVPDLAADLARKFFAAREETGRLRQPIDPILDEIEASGSRGPFVVADTADNAGGGAGSDSTFILRRLIERGVEDAALAMIWDPVVVQIARDAGVGSRLKVRLGGKTGPFAGDPVDVEADVVALADDIRQLDPAGGFRQPVGDAALLKVGGILVVVNTLRQQVFSAECFTGLGVDLAAQRLIVVKSSQHFHEAFAPLAEKVLYCETPGSLTLEFDERFYNRLSRPIWPLDADAAPA